MRSMLCSVKWIFEKNVRIKVKLKKCSRGSAANIQKKEKKEPFVAWEF